MSGKFAANAAWLTLAAISGNLLRAAGCLASGFHARARGATIRRDLIDVAARTALRGHGHLTLHLPECWPRAPRWQKPVRGRLRPAAATPSHVPTRKDHRKAPQRRAAEPSRAQSPGETPRATIRPKLSAGTLSAGTLSAAARREPERAAQFYAADDDAAGDLVAGLIRTGGYEPVRVGGLDQSIRIEMFGDLHEYGALGRVVTKSEALAAV